MNRYFKRFTEELVLAIIPPSFYPWFVDKTYLMRHGPQSSNKGLFLWEDKIIKNFFPPSPARILVCAAGGGRELVALNLRGYSLAGFEPILSSANHIKAIISKDRLLAFCRGTYEDLVTGFLQEIEENSPYDAVIVGWGSISNILDFKIHKMILESGYYLNSRIAR